MSYKEFLVQLSEASGVSGYEGEVSDVIKKAFKEIGHEVTSDNLGNLICFKKGKNPKGRKIMLAAHMDEVGLMVKDIDANGFIKFTTIGGVDQRTLLCQEVIVHGKEKVYGIIGVKPPHLTTPEERSKPLEIDNLLIDTGYDFEEINKLVEIGDVVTIKRQVYNLQNNHIAGKALDDRVGVAILYYSLQELNKLQHDVDVYFVATVQEEVGTRGATTSAFKIQPDIGIAIDVGFGKTPELNQFDTIEMGKGPAFTVGPNIHPGVFNHLKTTAKDHYIPYQVEVAANHSGTDAWPMQVSCSGVATGVISIPLRYMHTSVETVNLSDVEKSGKVLAHFIASLNDENMEELLCY
ncbi:M42 family metallopeptidase [Alkaliphilus serpentinus]|uniref:M42 family metallopeptidase n=1 Tax=Alkaliphilus serpentinus TaxID=1482731 RepID=A0A833HL50_9FIRM|nr:M42 family metallopeptidase [Alkaliphilus serpentinus]KAB3524945.1 M42 family metallopeptidase [Alkaliphilus serpentinus]